MATVSSLVFKVGLDAQQLEQGLKTTGAKIKNYAATATKALAGIATAGAAGYAAMLTSTVSTAREIEKLAQISNTSTMEFQRQAAAFKTVGFDMEKTGDIFKDMSDRIGDFIQTGGGPLADFFEQIGPKVGVTAEQFRNLSGPQALQLYVSSLEKANVNQNDMAFYMEAIASDTTALIPLLADGGRKLNELADAAGEAGVYLDSMDLKNAGMIRSKMLEVSNAFTGLKNEIVLGSLPALTKLTETMSNPQIIENMKTLGNAIASSISWAIEKVSALTGVVKTLAEDVAVFMNGIGAFDTNRLQAEIKKGKDYLENGLTLDTPASLIFMSDDEIRAEIARMEKQVADNMEAAKKRLEQTSAKAATISPTTAKIVSEANNKVTEATLKNVKSLDALTAELQADGGKTSTGVLGFDQAIDNMRRAMLQGDKKRTAQFKEAAERNFRGALRTGTADIGTLESMRAMIDVLTQKATTEQGTAPTEQAQAANKMLEAALKANTEAVTGVSKWLQTKPEPIGSITLDLSMDGDKMSTTLQGTAKHLGFLKTFVQKHATSAATGVDR